MAEKKRGHDAQDDVPSSKPAPKKGGMGEQDAPNYETSDRGQAIEVENLSSENDEGAN